MKTLLAVAMVLTSATANADEQRLSPDSMQMLGSAQICRLTTARQAFAERASKETRPSLLAAYKSRINVIGREISEIRTAIANANRKQLECGEATVRFVLSCTDDPNHPKQCEEPAIAPLIDYMHRFDTLLN